MLKGVNADAFAAELRSELDELKGRIAAGRVEMAREVLQDARGLTPRRTGKMASRWGAALGQWDPTDPGNDGEKLDGARFDQPIFVFCNDFRASFHEDGTVKMAARPMAAPALFKAEGVQRLL